MDPAVDDADARPTTIRFLLDGKTVCVAGISPQTTLLEYLRERCGRTDVKEGCAEGDCGACTVVLAEANDGDTLAWNPINACIRLLPTVDGAAVFTAQGLKGSDGALHPVQQAMVQCHASQCGFCTPGFVMSLLGLYKRSRQPSRATIDDALSGNLCRCTGYRPIVAAAQQMHRLPPPAGLLGPGHAVDGTPVATQEERDLAGRLRGLARNCTLAYEGDGQRYYAPTDIASLATLYADEPDARLVAGATDVGLWVTKQHRDLGTIIHTGAVRELRAVQATAAQLDIGAAVTLSEAFALIECEYPMLAEVWTRFASVPIRNSATLGGNVANGSPIGDSMPVLIALGARVTLRRGSDSRTIALEDLYLAYQKTALVPGEFIVSLHIPRRSPDAEIRAYKLSKRFDQDISAVFVCFNLQREGGRVSALRIGCGGVSATPSRARRCESALIGRPWSDASIALGQAALDEEFSPLTDMRASAGFRRTILRNLLLRFYIETTQPSVQTRVVEYVA